MMLANINNRLQHHNRKGNPGNPAYEADNIENRKYEKDDSSGVLLSPEVENRGSNTEDDLKDAGDPDNLLSEFTYHSEIQEGEDECDS